MKIKNKKWRNISMIIIGFTILIIVFEIIPRSFDLVSNYITTVDQEKKINELEILKLQQKNLQIEVNDLENNISKLVSNIESDKKISSIINLLNQLSDKAKVKIVSIKPTKISKKDNLWIQLLEVKMESRLENIYNLTRFLENADKVISFNKLEVKSVKPANDKLTINSELEVYLNL